MLEGNRYLLLECCFLFEQSIESGGTMNLRPQGYSIRHLSSSLSVSHNHV